jgi:hypothetical protein
VQVALSVHVHMRMLTEGGLRGSPLAAAAGIGCVAATVPAMLQPTRRHALPSPCMLQMYTATAAAEPRCATATGPRSWTLLEGQRREALDAILDVADVVLMTQVRPHYGTTGLPCLSVSQCSGLQTVQVQKSTATDGNDLSLLARSLVCSRGQHPSWKVSGLYAALW